MGTRPPGVNVYKFILTGGTLLRKLGTWREFTLFDCQDTNHLPAWERYTHAPDRVFKQGVCGHNAAKQSFYGSINQHQGNLFIPTACPGGIAAILTSEVREVPALPFDTLLDGRPVTIVELCFQASEVKCKLDTGEWYYLLEQVTTNGNQGDFVLHIPADDWVPVLPIPLVGWQLT